MAVISPSLAPISAVLALGTMAGQGRALAEQQARRLQEQQAAQQIAQQNIQNQMALDEKNREIQAQSQATEISRALEYSKQQQAQQNFEASLAQRKVENEAKQMLMGAQAQQQNVLANQRLTEQQAGRQLRADLGQGVQQRFEQTMPFRQAQSNRADRSATLREYNAMQRIISKPENEVLDPETFNFAKQRVAELSQELGQAQPESNTIAPEQLPPDLMMNQQAPQTMGQYQVGQVISNPNGRQGRVTAINADGSPVIQLIN